MNRLACLDPHRLSFSTACFAGCPLGQAAEKGRALGFRAIELLAFDGARHSQGRLYGFWFDRMTTREKDALRELVDPFDHVNTHAPFLDLLLFSQNPGVHEEGMRQLRVAIEATAFLGGSTTTMHVNPKTQCQYHEYQHEIVETMRRLGDAADEAGITITVETGFPAAGDLFAQLIVEIDHPAVGANIDVGHVVAHVPRDLWGTEQGVVRFNDELCDLVTALGQKNYHFHLHDVRREDFRDHRCVGRGIIDFPRLFARLRQMRCDGLLAFELEEPGREDALRESKERIESLLGPTAEE